MKSRTCLCRKVRQGRALQLHSRPSLIGWHEACEPVEMPPRLLCESSSLLQHRQRVRASWLWGSAIETSSWSGILRLAPSLSNVRNFVCSVAVVWAHYRTSVWGGSGWAQGGGEGRASAARIGWHSVLPQCSCQTSQGGENQSRPYRVSFVHRLTQDWPGATFLIMSWHANGAVPLPRNVCMCAQSSERINLG